MRHSHLTFCTVLYLHGWTAHISTTSEWPVLAKALVPSVVLLPAGRGRAGEKQNRTSSDLSGEQPHSSFLPSGDRAPKEAPLSLLLSPLRCPRPALLSLGHILPPNTPLFLCDTESSGGGGHLE